MENDKKWSNKHAIRTAFDDLDISKDLITDIIRERIELRNKYLKRAELKPMAKIRDDEDSHSTSRAQHMRQAAEIAKLAEVKKLVIGHFSSRYTNLTPLLEEAQAVFPNTELAKEGKIIEL